ncbi:TIR domain-containing protein [Streptomyces sp. NPDC059398]|uniref:tetratricopeptide repeat protein n=1 Tax=Streptomyces sp. NPDC059398 TaxID=3346820 RepID=UPI0036898A06
MAGGESSLSAPTDGWDVFVSYSRSDAERAAGLIVALRDQGLRVFVDDSAVDDFASITSTITRALARSRVLLALYSDEYPHRRACQWELTYAYLTGLGEGDPRRRILVVNPEPAAAHVHPVELRDARHWPWPLDNQSAQQLAASVAAYSATLDQPMGTGAAVPYVPWLPAPARPGSPHFTGRLAEQWRIHTALHRHRAPLVSGQGGDGRAAQLRGMPGIGKSLLAQEYALRFSPAFPGGIFWFDLHGCQAGTPSDTMDAYLEQIITVASVLGPERDSVPLPRLLSRLAVAMGERNAPCLWVVDGVPDGLSADQLHLLRGPHLLASTLITTRSRRYPSFAEAIDIGPLPERDGYHLVVSRRAPQATPDRSAALSLVHDLGGHPHALDLVAELTVSGTFSHIRNRLHNSLTDVLSVPTPASDARFPSGRRPLTAQLLTRSLDSRSPADDVLRLLALACPAPLTQPVIEQALLAVSPYDPWEAPQLIAEALETLLGEGFVQPSVTGEAAWTIHPLLARAVRRHDTDPARHEDLRRALLHALAALAGSTTSTVPAANSPSTSTVTDRRMSGVGRAERTAAFDLQIELITRVGVQPLEPDQGSLREALNSLHSIFGTTRQVLHRMAAENPTGAALPHLASALANTHLRPFLSTWHTALQIHEAACPDGMSPVEHERLWARSGEMRAALDALQEPLGSVAVSLAELSGTDLVVPPRPPA